MLTGIFQCPWTDIIPERTYADTEVGRFREALGPFVTAAEKTRMPMAFTDAKTPDDIIVFANDSLLALTGFGRSELIGRSFCRLDFPSYARGRILRSTWGG